MLIQTGETMGMSMIITKSWQKLLSLRAERAKLLGYKTHSHFVLEPRMAKVPENVFNLLEQPVGKSNSCSKE